MSNFEQWMQEFHAHLDVCRQCQENPFNLCAEGQKRLHSFSLTLSPEEARCQICGCTEASPCQLETGPCHWIVRGVVCSNTACLVALAAIHPSLLAKLTG